MHALYSSILSWGRTLALVSSVVVSAGSIASVARAEGVANDGFFVSGGARSGGSLVGTLGASDLPAHAVVAPSRQTNRVAARHTSPQERARADVGADIFPRSRLVMPLVVQAAIDSPADAEASVATMMPMSGPMVGLQSHPRRWGSSFDR